DEFDEPFKIMMRHLYYVSFTALASYFLAYLIVPQILNDKSYYLVGLYFLVGSYFICVLSRMAVIYFLEPYLRTPPFGQESIRVIMTDFPKLITHYFTLTFSAAWILAFIKLLKDQYVVQRRTLLLEKEKAETELKALKSQLNPHFLFNTLNNIYSLSLMNSPKTSSSIAGLSEILDHILYRCNSKYVPLSSEIALIANYLKLEMLRYDERLHVRFNHQVDQDAMIAPLILLALVENAFKHGAGEDVGKPTIEIDLTLKENRLSFRVTNTFQHLSPGVEKGDRIGLNNITKQLQLIYGGAYGLSTSNSDNIFVVLLTLDLSDRN
ncbi:MAG: histidine kinase, partial [Chitinophagaceae bacterium]